MYGFERLEYSFLKHASKPNTSLTAIYNGIMDDLILFTGNKKNFYDDVSILLIKRNAKKDILFEAEKIASLLEKYQIGNQPNLIKKFKNKTQEEIEKAIEEIQKKNQIEKAIKNLERLYETGDILKLKQDCIRYIQEGYLHQKINFYLKKALEYENKYKIEQKEKKLQEKYTILKELYKK